MGLFDRFKKPSAEPAKPAEVFKPTEPAKPPEAVKPVESKAPVEPTPAPTPAPKPVEQPAPEPAAKEPKRGFFARLTQGLKKTGQLLQTDVRDLFKSEGRLVDEAFL